MNIILSLPVQHMASLIMNVTLMIFIDWLKESGRISRFAFATLAVLSSFSVAILLLLLTHDFHLI